MSHKKKLLRNQKILLIESLIGILLIAVTFIVSAHIDISDTEQRLYKTVEYIKNQCNASQLRDLASESKSLLRVAESVEQIRWRLTYVDEAMDTAEEQAETLQHCAQDGYLDGLILLNPDGSIAASYDKAGFSAKDLLSRVDYASLMDTLDFPEKTYAVRIEEEDESHVDLAAVSRTDDRGVIVGYFYTSAAYTHIFNSSIHALVSGYEPDQDGMIVVSRGNRIIASNKEGLIGRDIEDVYTLKRIMERGFGRKLIHVGREDSRFGNNFGLMDKSQYYYIYAYMPERAVFEVTPKNLFVAITLYLFLLAVVRMFNRSAERSYQEARLREQQRYTEMLQEKNEQLEEAVKQAEKASAAKSNFLSRMSHDIRTPLNGIIGLLKVDEAHFDDKELIRNNHEKMEVSANHLLALINDILQMRKLEDGTVELTNEPMSLCALIREVSVMEGEHASEAGVTLESDTKSNLPYPYVYGSPLHLRQIFLNIYSNSIKYNKPGGKIYSSVECLSADSKTVTYRWTISDTGIGMSEEFLKHIFDPFTQEKNDARSVYQGTGLGMSIVKALLDQMNGSISVTSQEGVGSTFVITIPFTIAEKPQSKEPDHTQEASIRGRRFLLAEDNDLNAEIAKTLLEDKGATITVVSDGQQAVDCFKENPAGTYDAILMDVMMPVMDGLTAAKTIRAWDRPDAKTIPIVAMTANAFAEDAQKCMEAGMNAHLAKPLDIQRVVATLAGLIE